MDLPCVLTISAEQYHDLLAILDFEDFKAALNANTHILTLAFIYKLITITSYIY